MATFDVNAQVRKVSSTANGSTTEFSFAFNVNNTSDIDVFVDGVLKTESVHYDIKDNTDAAGLNSDGTGKVVFITTPTDHTPANDEIVSIKSSVPLSRTSVYTAGGNITAASLENDFDTITMQIGDNNEILNRTLKAPVEDPDDIDMEMPKKADRLGRVLGFNATTGNPEQGPTIADVQSLADITADIGTLADIEDGTDATDAIQNVAAISTEVQNVSSNETAITNVSTNMSAVTTVSTNINDVITVANDLNEAISEIETAANDLNEATSEIDTVANSITNVDLVGASISDVNTIANSTNLANVNTVGSNLSGSNTIGTVAGISSDVSAVAAIDSDVTVAANNVADINNFADVYQGASATNPTARADGSALQVGDLYFDTTNDVMKVYSSGGWITAASAINGTAERFTYTVSSSTTTITGNDDGGSTLAYDAGYIDVYLNGVKMVNGTDVTVTSGNSVVFATAIGASGTDTVDIIAYGTFELTNFSINDANDVQTTGVTDGQALLYNNANSRFEPGDASSAEVYGFEKDSDGVVTVRTTGGGDDNITFAQYDAFDEIVYASTGFTFSLNSSGNLILTV